MSDKQSPATGDKRASLNVEVSPQRTQGNQAGAAELDAIRNAYAAHHQQAQAEEQARHDKEMKALEKIAAKYEKKMKDALRQVGAPDENTLRAEMDKIAGLTDPAEVERQVKQLNDRYGSVVRQAIDAAGIDREAVRKEVEAAIPVPQHARRKDRKDGKVSTRAITTEPMEEYAIGTSWYTDPEYLPAPPPPPPQVSEVVLTAPYGLRATLGNNAKAELSNGYIYNYNKVDWIGSSKHLASVGSTFRADGNIRRVRVDGTINMSSFYTVVAAAIGYVSAEVILNLKVLDGTRLVKHNRLSLVRTICVIYWVASDYGSGRYNFSVEFDHTGGVPRTYSAIGELETWSGGGGIWTPATATGSGTVERLAVTLIR